MTGDNAKGRQKAARLQPCILQLSRPLTEVGFSQRVAVFFFPIYLNRYYANLIVLICTKVLGKSLTELSLGLENYSFLSRRPQSDRLTGPALFCPGNGSLDHSSEQYASISQLQVAVTGRKLRDSQALMSLELQCALSRCLLPHVVLSTKLMLPASSPLPFCCLCI